MTIFQTHHLNSQERKLSGNVPHGNFVFQCFITVALVSQNMFKHLFKEKNSASKWCIMLFNSPRGALLDFRCQLCPMKLGWKCLIITLQRDTNRFEEINEKSVHELCHLKLGFKKEAKQQEIHRSLICMLRCKKGISPSLIPNHSTLAVSSVSTVALKLTIHSETVFSHFFCAFRSPCQHVVMCTKT